MSPLGGLAFCCEKGEVGLLSPVEAAAMRRKLCAFFSLPGGGGDDGRGVGGGRNESGDGGRGGGGEDKEGGDSDDGARTEGEEILLNVASARLAPDLHVLVTAAVTGAGAEVKGKAGAAEGKGMGGKYRVVWPGGDRFREEWKVGPCEFQFVT
jgi:hypothetical protein